MERTPVPQFNRQPFPTSKQPQSQNYHSQSQPFQPVRSPIFDYQQRHLVLFAYNKQKDQTTPQQIRVLQQPKKKLKEDEGKEKVNLKSNSQQSQQEVFFLKKVDPQQKVELTQQIKNMLSYSSDMVKQERFARRREIFAASIAKKRFEQASEQVLAKRTIKVVKMDSLIKGGSIRSVVQLGGKSIEYESLDIGQNGHDYYTLIKKKNNQQQNYPCVEMNTNQILWEPYLLASSDEQEDPQDDDSNAQDYIHNDYPEQQDSDRSSEGIIANEDDLMDDQLDQEQIYRRYLRRSKVKQRQGSMDIQPNYEDYDQY